MDRLSEMEAFVAVVDQGGFTDAAKKLGMSKSAISKHVSSLEARLGARLLNRTTRRVNPTEIGLAYYDRATTVLTGALEADEMVNAMQTAPRGALRVSVPVSFGISQVSGLVGEFLNEYPEVSVNMVLDDRFVELVAEGFDVAIRIGRLEDSTLRARKLAESRALIVASPGYLAMHGTPETIDDLADHTLLHYSNLSTGNFWRLRTKSGEERHVRVGGRLTANNGESLRRAAESGLGIGLVPSFILGRAVEEGRLVALLPDVEQDMLGIYAVYPPGRFTQPKVRAFIDFLADRLKGRGPDVWPE
ncbi:LysR family transcriptional regulator [Halovulum dunhuangense]|uniref:LysR family transcriptional regulator n=1 Tax=Halovulum dunhuangense TaxID=1505036 RepID=A0A849KV01_9RHOB|nr:LysR family transcriptional regulator [Halovulum dunhuangense]NNU79178.1 LysR family transcriptional regulator [Halovulum dunhuangense]